MIKKRIPYDEIGMWICTRLRMAYLHWFNHEMMDATSCYWKLASNILINVELSQS